MTDISKEQITEYAIRLGDDAVVQGHRLSEWCSYGPFLEEDLALTNVALDFIGRARFDSLFECPRHPMRVCVDLVALRQHAHYSSVS